MLHFSDTAVCRLVTLHPFTVNMERPSSRWLQKVYWRHSLFHSDFAFYFDVASASFNLILDLVTSTQRRLSTTSPPLIRLSQFWRLLFSAKSSSNIAPTDRVEV